MRWPLESEVGERGTGGWCHKVYVKDQADGTERFSWLVRLADFSRWGNENEKRKFKSINESKKKQKEGQGC